MLLGRILCEKYHPRKSAPNQPRAETPGLKINRESGLTTSSSPEFQPWIRPETGND
jgi:hypothetical protein